jgi:hypothetical protein
VADRIPSAAQVQEAVERVYARPEYQVRHGFREWLAGVLNDVLAWLSDRLSGFGELRTTHPLIWWLVIGWLAASALALLAHIVWSTLQAARRADEPAAAADATSKRPRPRSAGEWEAEAARLAAAGRLREAAAALYQALLLRLDGRGAVRFDPAKTPGDYRREARAHPDAARALGGFLRLFEPVAFGGRGLDAEGWERLRTAAAEGGAGG